MKEGFFEEVTFKVKPTGQGGARCLQNRKGRRDITNKAPEARRALVHFMNRNTPEWLEQDFLNFRWTL